MSISSTHRILSNLRSAHAWRPSVVNALLHGVSARRRNEAARYSDNDHLRAAVAWLNCAQDAVDDGGISGRYTLSTGWTSSYPETTGYTIPTLLKLEAEGFVGSRARAERCIDFLLRVQLSSGAFPGMEIAENRDEPSVFNTAQILNGLTAWHRDGEDERVLSSARRAADWLVEMQDADGAWRKHLYGNRTYTYMAHAGCWLAEFGVHAGDERYLRAAADHLRWVLTHVDADTGWINDCGFEDGQHDRAAVTHTIAYTIWGILLMSQLLGNDDGIAIARRAAHAVARRLEVSRRLPGRLDWRWRPAASYVCLTGNCQMALIWLRLHEIDGDPALLSTACKALDTVKAAQTMTSRNSGIRGGIAGSDPLWGDYIRFAYPNWAAKFFIDGLLAKRDALAVLERPVPPRTGPIHVPGDVPSTLPEQEPMQTTGFRTVLLAAERSLKVEQFVEAWSMWGFTPSAIVSVRQREPSAMQRAFAHAREYGAGSLIRRALGHRTPIPVEVPRHATITTSGASVPEYAAEHGFELLIVDDLEATGDLERIRSLDADLFVYAGCGILRSAILGLPRHGTLNAHMGLLPSMRGMNVTEWSVLCGAPVGCTVHLIDPGIDTGDIIIFRPVPLDGVGNIDTLRQRVDRAQIDLLGEVVRWCIASRTLPPRRPQESQEGRQHFVMHTDVREALQQILRDNAVQAAPPRRISPC